MAANPSKSLNNPAVAIVLVGLFSAWSEHGSLLGFTGFFLVALGVLFGSIWTIRHLCGDPQSLWESVAGHILLGLTIAWTCAEVFLEAAHPVPAGSIASYLTPGPGLKTGAVFLGLVGVYSFVIAIKLLWRPSSHRILTASVKP